MLHLGGVTLGLALIASTAAWAGFETPVTPQDGNVVPGTGDFNWTALTRLFVGWDSNVELYADVDAPGNPALGGTFGGATLDLAFTKMLAPNLTLGGDFRADVLGYVDTMPAASIPTYGTQSDYDIVAAQPTVYLRYKTRMPDGTDVTLNSAYSFRTEKSKNEKGLAERSHQFMTSVRFDPFALWAFDLSAVHTFDDFNDIYPADPLSDRDGQFTELAAAATYRVHNLPLLQALHGRIAYQKNEANGINWSYSGVKFSAAADLHFHGPFDGNLWLSLATRDYAGNFSSQGYNRRTEDITTFGGQLLWHLHPRATADISVSQMFVGSNDPTLTSKNTRLTAGVTIRLK